ncbi:ATP-binding cassette domain-containing protein [Rickettsiales bacterium]|nr:ATP-binding cassette domain-containing protein [Rickettsiales bacterium]
MQHYLGLKKGQRDFEKTSVKLHVKGLHKYFHNKKVLKGVNLDVHEGESLVIIGGSGSGKSVLIKNLIGLMNPTKGVIKVDGEEVSNLSKRQRAKSMGKIGVLFQGGALFDSLPVWKNISFSFLSSKEYTREDSYDLAVAKLSSVGLGADVARLYPSELSGGMQKRVALARAIAGDPVHGDPDLIFFDEPTTGLDPIMADVINDLIVKCSEELGATTVTITHDMHSARKIADHVAMIYEGKIIWHDHVKNLDRSNNDYVEQFIHGRAEGPIRMRVRKG